MEDALLGNVMSQKRTVSAFLWFDNGVKTSSARITLTLSTPSLPPPPGIRQTVPTPSPSHVTDTGQEPRDSLANLDTADRSVRQVSVIR